MKRFSAPNDLSRMTQRRHAPPLSEVKVDHYLQLAMGRMARNMTLPGRILRQHDAACGNAADVAIARLKFDLASEPDHQLTTRRVLIRRIHLRNSPPGGNKNDCRTGASGQPAPDQPLMREICAPQDESLSSRRSKPRSR